MLEEIRYTTAKMAIGAYTLPATCSVIGTKAVLDTKNGNSGVLVRNNQTGIYSLFSCGRMCSVCQEEANVYASKIC